METDSRQRQPVRSPKRESAEIARAVESMLSETGKAFEERHNADAIATCDRVLASLRTLPACALRAQARIQSGRPQDAIADAAEAIRLDPNNDLSRGIRAWAYLTRK